MRALCISAAMSCVLLLAAASDAAAQLLGVSTTFAGNRVAPNACPTTQSHGVIGTDATVDWALARVAWSGAVASNGGAARNSVLRAQLLSPEWRGWRLDAASERERGDVECGGTLALQQRAGGLTFGWERSGVSLRYMQRITRYYVGIPRDSLTDRILGPTTRGFSLAGWHNFGRALVSLSLGSRSRWREQRQLVQVSAGGVDTIPSDSGPVIITNPGPRYETGWQRELAHAFGSELRFMWARGRLSFDALAGHSLGARDAAQGRLWGRSDAAIALTPTIALVGGYTIDDGWDTRTPAARRYFTLGARLTSAPFGRPADAAVSAPRASAGAFRLATGDDGRVTLGIRSATARLVEVTGDFVQWRPVRMQRIAAEWWELRMAISPGVHRVNVRVDGGAWNAPPGLPRQRDEFGGDAGVFTIP